MFNDSNILNAPRDIGKISDNLNQIAHHLNQDGMVTDSFCSDIRAVLVNLYQMQNEIKKIAGEYQGKPKKLLRSLVSM